MFSGYVCANCASIRTYLYVGAYGMTCLRCDDCEYEEFRDLSVNTNEDETPIERDA